MGRRLKGNHHLADLFGLLHKAEGIDHRMGGKNFVGERFEGPAGKAFLQGRPHFRIEGWIQRQHFAQVKGMVRRIGPALRRFVPCPDPKLADFDKTAPLP